MKTSRKRMRLEDSSTTAIPALKSSATMDNLPSDIMKNIFSYVGKGNYCFIGPVSKDFCFNYLTMDVIEDKFAHRMDLFLAMKKGQRTSAKAASSSFGLAEYCFLKAPEKFQKRVVRKAVEKGRKDIVEMGDALGVVIDERYGIGWQACPEIGRKGDFEMLQLLYEKGLIEKDSDNMHTIIANAARHNQLHFLECLQKNQLFTDIRRNIGAIIRYGTECGHMAILEMGANLSSANAATFFDEQFAGEIMNLAASTGDIEIVKWLRNKGIPWNENTFYAAASRSRIHLLQYLFENDCPYDDPRICTSVVGKDNHENTLKMLQFLHERGVPWNEKTCVAVIEEGNARALKYLRSNGCPWNRDSLESALNWCRSEIVEYCLRNSCPTGDSDICFRAVFDRDHGRALATLKLLRQFSVPWSEETCWHAARTGKLEALKWAVSQGCIWNQEQCANIAAENGHLDILKWMKLDGCQFDEETFAAAAGEGKGHLEVIRWLHSEKCPWNNKAWSNAIKHRHVDIIQYYIDQHFPFDEKIHDFITDYFDDPIPILKPLLKSGYVLSEELCNQAAMRQDFKLLRWLRFNNCPWDEEVCNYAVKNNNLDILKYAHENGCPWTKETYAFCLIDEGLDETVHEIPTYNDARSEEILDYLEEHDCPIPESSDWRVPFHLR